MAQARLGHVLGAAAHVALQAQDGALEHHQLVRRAEARQLGAQRQEEVEGRRARLGAARLAQRAWSGLGLGLGCAHPNPNPNPKPNPHPNPNPNQRAVVLLGQLERAERIGQGAGEQVLAQVENLGLGLG